MDNVTIPLVTPNDMKDFFSLIDHVLSGGVKNILLFGSTGEGHKIEFEAKKTMIGQLVPFIQNRARLFIALFGTSLNEMVNLANFCEDAGFTAALVSIAHANDKQFFLELLAKTRTNYILYNTPSSPTTEICEELFNNSRIVGLKDSSGNIEFVQELVKKYRRDSLKIYYGREYQIEKALSIAIDGIFPAIGNIRPDLALKLWEKRDTETFSSFHDLKKQIDEACPGNYLQGLKNLLMQRGIIH